MPQPKRTAPLEIGLSEAATMLQVSEKTIRTYIKRRLITAAKVSGTWYIDKASVMSLAARNLEETSPPSPPPSSGGEDPEESVEIPMTMTAPPSQSSTSASLPALAIHGLACYRLFLAAMSQLKLENESQDTRLFLMQTSREVLAALGAGYYGYGRAKRWQYELSRAAMGKILAVLASDPALFGRHSLFATMLERDVIPAFGPLMRKLERRDLDPGLGSKNPKPVSPGA